MIELMVVVVVAGVLAAIAYPAYTQYVLSSRRSDAAQRISTILHAQERYRSNNTTYADTLAKLDLKDKTNYYEFSLGKVNGSFIEGFVVTAKPLSTSPQAKDVDCSKITATLNGGELKYSGETSGSAVNDKCWKQ